MPLKVEEAQPDDFAKFVDLMFAAVDQREAFVNAAYPHHDDPTRRQSHGDIMKMESEEDPACRSFKTIDTDRNDEIIGVAKWSIYHGPNRPAEEVIDAPESYWDSVDDREWVRQLHTHYLRHRWQILRETKDPIVCLEILTVAPEHQRRGAGTMLTKWGTKLANDSGGQCLSTAFEPGVRLYERLGFKVEGKGISSVSANLDERQKQKVCFMRRPKASTVG